MEDNRVNEALECTKKAEKYLKTSLTKWKPDYDSAATEYDRAAICYKNVRKLDLALTSFLKSAECYENCGNSFHSAKGKEQAALIAKEMNDINKAKDLMEQAAQIYAETGSPETSAMALEKAGRFFESIDLTKAIEIYEKALKLVPGTDESRMSGEFLRRIGYCYLKLEKLPEAASCVKREIDLYRSVDEPSKIGKLVTCLVIINLARDDPVQAEKELTAAFGIRGFVDTADAPILKPLIDAYYDADDKKFQLILNHHHLKSNENEILRLMKKVKIQSARTKNNTENDAGEEDNGLL